LAELRFRAAAAGDVEAVVSLTEGAYRGDSSRRGWTTEADLLDGQRTDAAAVRALLGDPRSLMLLAERDGELLACAHLERRGESAYFGMFSVRPDRQGTGLGRQVLAEAERIARTEWRCRSMSMKVIDLREALIQWYERRGYRRTGEYQRFPYGDPRFGLPRRDDLRFETLTKSLEPRTQVSESPD
jgi:GNAT superfamily N-acetyltransferase